MNLQQAKELEANRQMLVVDEADLAGIQIGSQKYQRLWAAIQCWAESVADLRSHESVEQRTTAAAEASQNYINAVKQTTPPHVSR